MDKFQIAIIKSPILQNPIKETCLLYILRFQFLKFICVLIFEICFFLINQMYFFSLK